MLKPRIRFNDFTNEWQPLSLGEVTLFKRGYDLPTSQRVDGEFPVISSSGYSGRHSEYKVNGPGLVTGRYGSIGEIYLVNEPHWPLNTALYVDNLFNNNIHYCYFLLQTIDFKRFSDKTGVPGVNRNDLHKIQTAIPSIQEQQKIADFLTSVDTKISQLTEKHRLLKEYKKGVMQQIFSQQIRFKDKDGEEFPEWKEFLFSDIAQFSKGKGISKSDIVENGKTPCIRYGELYTIYGEVINSISSYTNVETSALILSEINDVILPCSGETQIDIATASCVTIPNVAYSGDLTIVKSKINGVFLSYFLNSAKKTTIAALSQGSSVIHLYASHLKTMKLTVPTSKEEQHKIAQFLQSIDQKIDAVAEQIEQTKQFKKGLLQQMFV